MDTRCGRESRTAPVSISSTATFPRPERTWSRVPPNTAYPLPARWHGIIFLRYSSTQKKAILQACGYSRTSSTGIPEFFHRRSRPPWASAFSDSMLIIPALDIKDGHCVRLKQGKMNEVTVFSEDPVAMARHWKAQGARRLHVVDLNGAAAGKPKNEPVIRAIVKEVGDTLPVQLGGGIRDLDTIEHYLDLGVSYIIIGTAAVKNPGFLQDASTAFSGHIIVALDAKDGKVAVEGWSKMTGHDVVDLAKKFQDYGVESVIYTNIGRDGMLTGVNIDATLKLARELRVPVIASGGLTSIEDIKALCKIESEGISAVITGRAIYQGTLDFKKAQAEADKLGKSKD